MQTFNNESMILEAFRTENFNDMLTFGNFLECKKIHITLTGVVNHTEWTQPSDKDMLLPYSYDAKHKVLMDIIKLDDLSSVSQKEHDFESYFHNFEKAFKGYEDRIDLYKQKFHGYKTLIFIYDETLDFKKVNDNNNLAIEKDNSGVEEKFHVYCLDKKFVEIIKNSKVDYVIWYSPLKVAEYVKENQIKSSKLPKAAVYDVKHLTDKKLIEYQHELMINAVK